MFVFLPALSLLPELKPTQKQICSVVLKQLMSIPISAIIADAAVLSIQGMLSMISI